MEIGTINQAPSKHCPLPPSRLRAMLREGKLPGFYSGTRYYVNYTMLMDQLDRESRRNGGELVEARP